MVTELMVPNFIKLAPSMYGAWSLSPLGGFTTQRADFWLFEEQLRRWQLTPLTPDQAHEVERLVGQMKALRENNEQVLQLAQELSEGTIEKQMAKSDLELGLEALRNPNLLRRKRPSQ